LCPQRNGVGNRHNVGSFVGQIAFYAININRRDRKKISADATKPVDGRSGHIIEGRGIVVNPALGSVINIVGINIGIRTGIPSEFDVLRSHYPTGHATQQPRREQDQKAKVSHASGGQWKFNGHAWQTREEARTGTLKKIGPTARFFSASELAWRLQLTELVCALVFLSALNYSLSPTVSTKICKPASRRQTVAFAPAPQRP
jgi:hypothetical protein